MVELDILSGVVVEGTRLPGSAGERRSRITVRELSSRVLLVEVGGYQCTVALGAVSAVLVDPLDEDRAAQVVALVREHYAREISDVIYSHAHADHVSGTARVAAETRHPVPLAIHAVSECAENVVARGRHPAPSVVHPSGEAFELDGISVRLELLGGHTEDSTLVLFPDDAVAHAVDLVHPGQAEFFDFGAATDLWSYERAIDTLAGAQWRVLTAGHGQLGWPSDVRLVQEYLRDLRAATSNAIAATLAAPLDSPDVANARVDALRRGIRDRARGVMLEAWASRLAGLDYTVDSHISRMADELLYFG